jgi:hypothetical protein
MNNMLDLVHCLGYIWCTERFGNCFHFHHEMCLKNSVLQSIKYCTIQRQNKLLQALSWKGNGYWACYCSPVTLLAVIQFCRITTYVTYTFPSYEPGVSVTLCFLASCQLHGNVESSPTEAAPAPWQPAPHIMGLLTPTGMKESRKACITTMFLLPV